MGIEYNDDDEHDVIRAEPPPLITDPAEQEAITKQVQGQVQWSPAGLNKDVLNAYARSTHPLSFLYVKKATIQPPEEYERQLKETLQGLPPLEKYEEFMRRSDLWHESRLGFNLNICDYVMQRSNLAKVQEYDQMVDEFNREMEKIKSSSDIGVIEDFIKTLDPTFSKLYNHLAGLP